MREGDARALTFTTLVLGNLALIATSRSRSRPLRTMLLVPNAALWSVVFAGLAALAIVLYVPPVRDLFDFSILHPVDLLECVAAAALVAGWFELLKRRRARGEGDHA